MCAMRWDLDWDWDWDWAMTGITPQRSEPGTAHQPAMARTAVGRTRKSRAKLARSRRPWQAAV